MKKFLTILVILITFITNAQVTKDTVYNDAKEVVSTLHKDLKDSTPKIATAIQHLAKELKVTADHVWDVLVKQQLVFSIAILIGLIINILSWIHFWYRFNQGIENRVENKYYKFLEWTDSSIAACVITGIIALIGTIIIICNFMTMLTGFINPEFGAMKDIVEFASKLN